MDGRPRTLSTPARSPLSPEFDERTFRSALGRFATGVIVLTVGPRRTPHAMTANAFMSGSLAPPLVVVSVGLKARMHDRITRARRFGVSILETEQEAESRYFAGQPVARFAPRFAVLAGVPVLARAAVVLAARVAHRYTCGDHTLVVGEVERFEVDPFPSPPLVFYNGRYRELQPVVDAPGRSPEIFPSFF